MRLLLLALMAASRNGVVYTPAPLAECAADRLRWAHEVIYKRAPPAVVDPGCGRGALLNACKVGFGAHTIGYDIDATAVAHAAANGHKAAVRDIFDVRQRSGVVIANPPYIGRGYLGNAIGPRMRCLKRTYCAPRAGACDLAGYFLRHVLQSWRPCLSTWIVTNTIAQGSTRRVGLQWALGNGFQIVSALKDIRWPGAVRVIVHVITILNTRVAQWPHKGVEYLPNYKL